MGRNALANLLLNTAVRDMWFCASGSPWLSRKGSVNLLRMELMGAIVLRNCVGPKHHSLMSLG